MDTQFMDGLPVYYFSPAEFFDQRKGRSWDIYDTGWWFGTWLLFSISYMGYDGIIFPLTNSYFSEGLEPPTRIFYNYISFGQEKNKYILNTKK